LPPSRGGLGGRGARTALRRRHEIRSGRV